jgi:hypothetical protein
VPVEEPSTASGADVAEFLARRRKDAMARSLAEPAVRAKFAEFGLDVASREQQMPGYLAKLHGDEIEKWWPIIKAANIRAQ